MSVPETIRATGRLLLAALPLWLIGSLATSSALALPIRAVVVAVGVLALCAPARGLVVLALLTPLGALVAPIRFAEALVVAFFAGWLLRPSLRHTIGPSPPAMIKYAAWSLASIVVSSVAVQALQARAPAAPSWSSYLLTLSRSYFDVAGDPLGAVTGARLLEGVGLSAAVILLLRTTPMLANWIPEALGIGSVLAAAASLLLWLDIAFPAAFARDALGGDRFSAHVGDVNAAGSYFAMLVCISTGMSARAGGLKRVGWAAMSVSALVGMWLCESPVTTTAAMMAIATVAIWVLTGRWSRARRVGLLVLVLLTIVGAGLARQRGIAEDPTSREPGVRTEFAQTSYQMMRARPWFGIGIGQHRATSSLILAPQLAWASGGEHAHDYFVQVAAEIGLVGLAACAVLLVGTAGVVARALRRAPVDYRLIGLAAGVAAVLLISTTGHPLLVSETAYPFWIAVGLLVVLASPVAVPGDTNPQHIGSRWQSIGFVAAVTLVVVSIPLRARGAAFERQTREVEGLHQWREGPDGRRYRWTSPYDSIFVEGNPPWVVIPVRAPADQRGAVPTEVGVSVDGQRPGRWPVGTEWRSIRVELPPMKFPALGFRRINIRTDPPRSLPDPVGTGAEVVGVQIGEPLVPTDAPR